MYLNELVITEVMYNSQLTPSCLWWYYICTFIFFTCHKISTIVLGKNYIFWQYHLESNFIFTVIILIGIHKVTVNFSKSPWIHYSKHGTFSTKDKIVRKLGQVESGMLEIRLNFITDWSVPTHRLQNHCNNQIHLTDHPLHHSKREAQAFQLQEQQHHLPLGVAL